MHLPTRRTWLTWPTRPSGVARLEEPTQRVQVLFVERIKFDPCRRSPLCLRRLEEHRQLSKPWIVDETAKRLDSEKSLSDVLVPIDAAAERPFRIVR